jgi:riboflavin kinase/FMN adenylyltransferase
MHVCFDIRKIDYQAFDKPVVTLGSFDGVHLGHQAIIRRLTEKSREKEKLGMVVTFEPHPQSVVASKDAPRLLTTLEEKLELLEGLGVDETVVMNFDQKLKDCSAGTFVEEILVEKLNVGELVVGDDHAFGKDRAGRIDLLKGEALKHDFGLEVVPALETGGKRISSTRIRRELEAGEFSTAKSMLGHSYPIFGSVIRGEGRGRTLDYPTLNLEVSPRKLLPRDGVYSTRIEVEETYYQGMLYLGPLLTFGEQTHRVEVHVFGFKGQQNERKIKLWMEDWVREPRKFEDVDRLKKQLISDEKTVKEMLKTDRSKSIKRV